MLNPAEGIRDGPIGKAFGHNRARWLVESTIAQCEKLFWTPEKFKKANKDAKLSGNTIVEINDKLKSLIADYREVRNNSVRLKTSLIQSKKKNKGDTGCRPLGYTAALEYHRAGMYYTFPEELYKTVSDCLYALASHTSCSAIKMFLYGRKEEKKPHIPIPSKPCNWCIVAEATQRCGACKVEMYCSKRCQKNAWNSTHKKHCW
jgi:hypothetical protein